MTAFYTTGGQASIAVAAPPLTITTRFAPSPTGRLHLGHAYSAMRAHDLARSAGGRFVLRIEDIDTARCRDPYTPAIFDDLRWLGIDWDDDPVIQSTGSDRHQAALDRLRDLRLLYPCACTRADIAAIYSAPHGVGTVYPGTCRPPAAVHQASSDLAERIDIVAAQRLAGVDLGLIDDVVLARKGLKIAYHLAVVVDDAAAGVTDVMRGRDLATVAPIHQLLQRLLGLPTLAYHHHPLIMGPDSLRLAKRNAGATLADLRAEGVDGAAVLNDLRMRRLPVGFAFDTP